MQTENPLAGVQQEQKRPVGRGRGRASLKPKVDTQAPPPGPVGFLDDPRREGPLPNQDTGPRRHPRNFGGHSFADVKNEMRNRPGVSTASCYVRCYYILCFETTIIRASYCSISYRLQLLAIQQTQLTRTTYCKRDGSNNDGT